MGQDSSDFKARFYAQATHLGKLKLAIRENRYILWPRPDNLAPAEFYLRPVLDLPDNHKMEVRPRKSGGPGAGYIIQTQYLYTDAGRSAVIYLKAFYGQDGQAELVIVIQSLRTDEDRTVSDKTEGAYD